MKERELPAHHQVALDGAQHNAHRLATFFPPLIMSARALAAQLAQGVHGRRRAGAGDQFWQFRPLYMGESVASIDWRRSARDQHFYVREREWEGAHQVFIWVNRSATMRFRSDDNLPSKEERALVLALALSDLLVRGGERVGLMGMSPALSTRRIIEHFAQCFETQSEAARHAPLPPAYAPHGSRAHFVILSDCLLPLDELAACISALAQQGARGHVLLVHDPIEETFPFEGHVELSDVGNIEHMRFGDGAAVRQRYIERFERHRDDVDQLCRAQGWSCARHRTDRAAAHALLALQMHMAGDAAMDAFYMRDVSGLDV